MGFFTRKSKRNALEFCQDFYDSSVFGSASLPDDISSMFADTVRCQIAKDIPSFGEISLPMLTEELRALRLEMIGTAWTHRSKEKVALAISEFTKKYLASIDRSDLWEGMTDYNLTVAQWATYGTDPNSRLGRARITFMNVTRVNFFDEWVAVGFDPEAVSRVASRLCTDLNWKTGIIQKLLAIQLTRRLDFVGSDGVCERLAAVVHGFYQGAHEALDGTTLIVS